MNDEIALKRLLGDAALRRVLDAIDRDGDETRIVGGAVRDALTGRRIKEIDLATTATPELVLARAEAAGIRAIPTGLAHGTITLLVNGETFEATSLREDVDTDGRHAQVRFGRDFEADALRRDFTINALFLARDGQIFDYVGGLEDLAAGRVRFIGDPARRIREDYLRILRFFRFSAEFSDGPLDGEGLRAAMRERAGLARLSRERVRAELLKLLVARRAPDAVQQMSEAGLLGPLIAAAPNPARLRTLAKIADDAASDPLLRLAALCLDLPEDAERIGERLRLSNAERQRLARAASLLVRLHGASARAARRRTAPPALPQRPRGREGCAAARRYPRAGSGAMVASAGLFARGAGAAAALFGGRSHRPRRSRRPRHRRGSGAPEGSLGRRRLSRRSGPIGAFAR